MDGKINMERWKGWIVGIMDRGKEIWSYKRKGKLREWTGGKKHGEMES